MSSSDAFNQRSFTYLPRLFHNLKRTNRNTITHIKKDENNRFQMFFVAFGCLIRTFVNFMLPLLFIDIVPLTHDDRMMLFIAVGVDGNHESLLVAYGMGTMENVENWSWFLRRLKECIGDATKVAFISKMSTYIASALNLVFPESYHGYCCMSVASNLQIITGRNRHIEEMFFFTSKTYEVSEVYRRMVHLKHALRDSANGDAWLDNIPIDKWARAFFPKSRFNVMTVDIPDWVEILSVNTENRSITQLIHHIHLMIEGEFLGRYSFAGRLHDGITPYARTKLNKRMHRSANWRATSVSPETFRVEDSDYEWLVKLDRCVCQCGKWQKSGIPCGHAIAAMQSNDTQHMHLFVNYFLTSEVYRFAYRSDVVKELPPWEVWEFPNDLEVVLAPLEI